MGELLSPNNFKHPVSGFVRRDADPGHCSSALASTKLAPLVWERLQWLDR
jgi:hypothetical protein